MRERRLWHGRNFPVSSWTSSLAPYHAEVAENVPLTIDIGEFEYVYRCKRCGHRWREVHIQKTES